MAIEIQKNYLEDLYLNEPYLQAAMHSITGAQFTAVIDWEAFAAWQFSASISTVRAFAAQLEGVIADARPLSLQFESTIVENIAPAAMQFSGNIAETFVLPCQIEAFVGKTTGLALQFQAIVTDELHALGAQLSAIVNDKKHSTSAQFQGVISQLDAIAIQFSGIISSRRFAAAQFSASIENRLQAAAQEFEAIIGKVSPVGIQFEGKVDDRKPVPLQFESEPFVFGVVPLQTRGEIVDAKHALGLQFTATPTFHKWAGYLVEEYLVTEYLEKRFNVHAGFQFEAKNIDEKQPVALQYEANIVNKKSAFGVQFQGTLTHIDGTGIQFDSVAPAPLALQFRVALYNTDNLRILTEFPSRGIGVGGNWTASSTAPGDFTVANLNTDIVEQKWRSQTGSVTGLLLTCDTGLPQGVYLDTFAILGHNITTSATVLLEGDDDPAFGSPGFSQSIMVERESAFWIAPTLPLAGYRYWRLSIDDSTNADNYVEIGTIVFGEAVIFAGECFKNPLRLSKKHFTDKVYTEGFTAVSNDRGIKRSVILTFESLQISGGNYANLTDIIETARTSLKCLWIPTPKYPSRYAVFGKLAQLPEEEHNDLGETQDYVSLTVEVDESL